MMTVDELVIAAIMLEKRAKELVEVANKLYDSAITLAIAARDEHDPSRLPNPVRADKEEDM